MHQDILDTLDVRALMTEFISTTPERKTTFGVLPSTYGLRHLNDMSVKSFGQNSSRINHSSPVCSAVFRGSVFVSVPLNANELLPAVAHSAPSCALRADSAYRSDATSSVFILGHPQISDEKVSDSDEKASESPKSHSVSEKPLSSSDKKGIRCQTQVSDSDEKASGVRLRQKGIRYHNHNGVILNGVILNDVIRNVLIRNVLIRNGVTLNGLIQNGLIQNGLI
ncbi:hypothetical protein D9C73_015683 [Collichthys lucidus]|uniref:Uncharacterized protein n=1 Tax=Collichthys lucidus TaxID=240159 RepID=A0A4U5V2B3_COLLU|nr:hypothetical protein D9C73_015683 [Collichthys lucidus]